MTRQPLRLGFVIASTRDGRFADFIAPWLIERMSQRAELEVVTIDLRDHPLPPYNKPFSPISAPRSYESDAERELGEIFDSVDGLVMLVNEYNHGYTAVLKNTIDHYHSEFNRKPVSFAGYGNAGGARAIEQLREVAAELEMASLRHQLPVLGYQMGAIRVEATRAETLATLETRLDLVLNEWTWWADALRTARLPDSTEIR